MVHLPVCFSVEPEKIPVSVINTTAFKSSDFPVKAGIPFAAGHLYDKDIHLLSIQDKQGNDIPAQFEPFVYWWAKGRSVKWLMVDLLANIESQSTDRYFIVKKEDAVKPKSQLSVIAQDKEIIVHTGPLKAVISRTTGSILESVYLDINNDQIYSTGERVIQPDKFNGIQITSDAQQVVKGSTDLYNMWGSGSGRIKKYKDAGFLSEHTYMSGAGRPDKVVVETNGPVRATILLQGKHYPQTKGDGINQDGFYHYTTRLHFYAGKPFIRIDHAIDNNRDIFPIHIYQIKDLRLHFSLDLNTDAGLRYDIGGERNREKGPLTGSHISIFQDSANQDRWNLHSELQNKSEKEQKETPGYFYQADWKIGPAKFRGYRICTSNSVQDTENCIGSGDHAPGWAGLYDDEKGLSVHVDRFWEECPKAIVFGKNNVDAVLFPDFSPEDFQIHSGTRKNHVLYLNFISHDDDSRKIEAMGDLFRYPPLLKADQEQYAASLAMPRAMGINKELEDKQSGRWYPHSEWHKNIITARWQTLGHSSNFNQGGMHDNYWPIFSDYIQSNNVYSYEKGEVFAKWASESIPWLINDYSFSPSDTEPHNRLIGYDRKVLFTSKKSSEIKGWVRPYNSNIPAFSSPTKVHMDGEHLIHVWPFELFYLSGSPIARDGLMGLGNQAKYSVHRNFFKAQKNHTGKLNAAPSLDHIFYFDDTRFPERVPGYFYTRIYASHLLSTAMTYGATGDEDSLFYAQWLTRRMLYLQKQNGGVLGKEKRWKNIAPWQEAEGAIAAFELYKETGDEEMLDIMGSWLEWAWHEAYVKGKGMPHRFKRGTPKDQLKKTEHHWYPGVAAPLCYAALGDPRALTLTKEWANSRLAYIKKGEFLNEPVGQSASYVLNYLEKSRQDKIPPENASDLAAAYDTSSQELRLTWTAPEDKGTNSTGSAKKYWIKIADKPIVDHPKFPDHLDTQTGFYQADNIRQEPEPGTAGTQETFTISAVAPHGAYGSDKEIKIRDLETGTYYLALKSWDAAGNISELSNIAQVEIR